MLSNFTDSFYFPYVGIILTVVGLLTALRFQKKPLSGYLGLCCLDIGYAVLGLGIHNDSAFIGSLSLLSFNFVARALGFLALYSLCQFTERNNSPLQGIAKARPYTATLFALSMFSAIEICPFFTPDAKHHILYGALISEDPSVLINYGYAFFLTLLNIGTLIITLFIVHKLFQGNGYTYSKSNICEDIRTSSVWQHVFFAALIVFGLSSHSFLEYLIANFADSTSRLEKFPHFAIAWNIETFLLYAGAFLLFVCGFILPALRKLLAFILVGAAFVCAVMDTNVLPLSYLFSVLVTFMAVVVTVYSFGYIKRNENIYYFLLFLMFGSVVGLVTNASYGAFFVFWEIMTISSYVLVAFDDTPKAHYAAKKYFLMSGIGALVMLPAFFALQIIPLKAISSMLPEQSAVNVLLYVCVIAIFIGFAVKAGIFPFHSWLPDAHPAAPASVSAPLSGILTKTGFYGILFFLFTAVGFGVLKNSYVCPFFGLPSIGVIMVLLGLVTMFYGEIMAYRTDEIKRLFAYSTIAQVGEICMTLGVFSSLAVTGALLHIINHSMMKDLLFLCTGVFLVRSGLNKIEDLKGLGKVMPFTAVCMIIGLLSILGLPPFAGFNSKFIMLFALADYNPVLPALMLIASLIGCVYYTRIIRILVFEKYEGPEVHDACFYIKAAMGILAAACIILGLYPELLLNTFITPVTNLIASSAGFNLSERSALDLVSITTITWRSPAIIIVLGAALPVILRKSPLQCGISSVFVLGLAAVSLIASMGYYDTLSFMFALGVTVIGAATACYSIGYMEHNHAQWRYYASFLCMCGGLAGVATSSNLYSFFFFWEIMSSWTLYFVIIHEETKASLREGFKYFLFNMIGAGFLFLGVILTIHWLGTADFAEMKDHFGNLTSAQITAVFALLVIGFLMKAAQLPFRIDIQMHPATAPTPVSGYISSVLLKSAIFGLAKLIIVFGGAGLVTQYINLEYISIASLYIGAVTIVMAAGFAVFQSDIKLVLIYSTVSQLGYMVVGISLGTSLGIAGGLLHLVNHLFFKDLLFLIAGVIIAQTHIYNMSQMGGLGLKMPKTLALFAVGAVCVIGLPPSNGFTSKWIIYHALMDQGYVLPAILSLVGSVLTLAYMAKFLHSVFLGQVKPSMEKVHEAPKTMLYPMAFLALGCIVTSLFPGLVLMAINKVLISAGLAPLDVALWGINSGKGAWNATLTAILLFVVWFAAQKVLQRFTRTQRVTSIHTCGMPEENFNPSNAEDIYSTKVLFGNWNDNKEGR